MRFCPFVLFITTVLLARAGPASATRNSSLATPGAGTLASPQESAGCLRADACDEESDEERGWIKYMPSFIRAMYYKRLIKGLKPFEAAETLNFVNHFPVRMGRANVTPADVVKLLDSTRYKVWVKKHWKGNELAGLLTLFGPRPTAHILYNMRLFDFSRKRGEIMRRQLYSAWELRGIRPTNIFKLMGNKLGADYQKFFFNGW